MGKKDEKKNPVTINDLLIQLRKIVEKYLFRV
jgi:hypothetical protein